MHDAIKDKRPFREIVSLIDDNIVVVMVDGRCALHWAVEAGDVEVVTLLAKHKLFFEIREEKTGNSVFHLAVLQNSRAMLAALGAQATAEDLECTNKEGYTPFLLACMEGKVGAAHTLQSMGARIDAKGGEAEQTALHYAAGKGHAAIIPLFKNRLDLVNAPLTKGWPKSNSVACGFQQWT